MPIQGERNMKMNAKSKIQEMEMKSSPRLVNGFNLSGKVTEVVNGVKLTAESRVNSGGSGKGFTTLWYVDGKRISKANAESLIGEMSGN